MERSKVSAFKRSCGCRQAIDRTGDLPGNRILQAYAWPPGLRIAIREIATENYPTAIIDFTSLAAEPASGA